MNTEKKCLKKLSDKELFDYLEKQLKQSIKTNPTKKLMKIMKIKLEAN